MRPETKSTLQFFVEKAHYLDHFEFDKHVKMNGFGINMQRTENDNWEITFDLPEVKDRDAFLLTFRMFVQNNEKISFQKLNLILVDTEISGKFRQTIIEVQEAYFTYLNSCSEYTVDLFEGHPTRMEMLNTVLYGGLVHGNNATTIQRYKEWSRNEISENLLLQEFTKILLQILVFVKYFAKACEFELTSN